MSSHRPSCARSRSRTCSPTPTSTTRSSHASRSAASPSPMTSAMPSSSWSHRLQASSPARRSILMAGSPRPNNDMPRKLIDLSMPVHNDMVSFPRVVRPALVMYETWKQFAERVGAAKFGVDWLTAHCLIVLGDHIGTHMDSLRHMREDAPGPEGIPLDYCYGDGICLDFRHLPKGAGISVDDVKGALSKINYT